MDNCYSVEKYKKVYVSIIYPMPSEDQWLKTEHEKVEPLKSRLTPSRPKKVRIKAPDKPRDKKKYVKREKVRRKDEMLEVQIDGAQYKDLSKEES